MTIFQCRILNWRSMAVESVQVSRFKDRGKETAHICGKCLGCVPVTAWHVMEYSRFQAETWTSFSMTLSLVLEMKSILELCGIVVHSLDSQSKGLGFEGLSSACVLRQVDLVYIFFIERGKKKTINFTWSQPSISVLQFSCQKGG